MYILAFIFFLFFLFPFYYFLSKFTDFKYKNTRNIYVILFFYICFFPFSEFSCIRLHSFLRSSLCDRGTCHYICVNTHDMYCFDNDTRKNLIAIYECKHVKHRNLVFHLNSSKNF